jgi:hypothetical protein
MAYLIANIPPIEVFVRKEFLYDFLTDEKGNLLGKGEYESAHWLTVKSIPNQALYFESLIHDFGAVYDKLPLHAYVWRKDVDPERLYPLDWLQLWDGMGDPQGTSQECKVRGGDERQIPRTWLLSVHD